jgi:hypothetical protein
MAISLLGFQNFYFKLSRGKKIGNKKFFINMNSENFEKDEKTLIIGKKSISFDVIKEREVLLKNLEEEWKRERISKEELKNKKFGFTKNSEILNGRLAMFFLVTGLLTELWASQTIPEQIETIVRIFGII